MENILKRILKSNTTLIGYDSRNEINANRLINLIPNIISFTGTGEGIHTGLSYNSNKILEHFDSLSHFRDYKLASLLDDETINYVVLDISYLTFFTENDDGTTSAYPGAIANSKKLRNFLLQLQSRLYNLSSDESSVKFKLIVLSQIWSDNNLYAKINFKGDDAGLYISDLVIQMVDDTLKITKDRYLNSKNIMSIKEEFRQLTIKQLFDEIT